MLAITLADFNFIGTANAQALGGGGIAGFLPFVLILGVMYFLVIRPQSKKAKEHREMVAALKKGDRVVVSNGIFGVVSKIIDDQEVAVEIASGVEVTVVRSSVSQVISKTTAASAGKSEGTAVKKTTALKKAAAKKPAVKKAAQKKEALKKTATKKPAKSAVTK